MRHTRVVAGRAALFAGLCACMALALAAGGGGDHHLQIKRDLPAIAHYLTDEMVLVVDEGFDGEARTQGLTKTQTGEVGPGVYLPAVSVIYEGAIVNSGTDPITLLVLGSDPNAEPDGTFNGVLTLWPGENIVVLNSALSQQYKKQCICQCGNGWVSVGNNPPCTQFNGQGPCIDPTCQRQVASFSNCKQGWGPGGGGGSSAEAPPSDASD